MYVVIRLIMGLLYNLWLLSIYIVAMTLSTFWVQDIFDELIQVKLMRQLGENKVIKNPGKILYNM